MAIQPGTIRLTAILQDGKAKNTSKTFEVNPAHTDMASAAAIVGANGLINLAAITTKIEAVTEMRLQKYRLSVDLVNDAADPGEGSHLDAAAVTVDLTTIGKKATIMIPSPLDTIFVGDGAFGPEAETIDGSDVALAEFVALYNETEVDDDNDPEGVFLLSDGEQVSDTSSIGGRKVR
jgi:hypothetical protein